MHTRGTELHQLAADAIRLGVKFQDNGTTISQYVNDAIGFRMSAEVTLYFSDNCFGTADAISFSVGPDGVQVLRIHDLKTGISKTSHIQLMVYAALFCLEYAVNPFDIEIYLRIYQNDDIREYDGNPMEITRIMEKIMISSKIVDEMRMEAL